MNGLIQKLTHFRYLLISVFILGLTLPCYADDLDAYVISPVKTEANALLVLDHSGSMRTHGRDRQLRKSLYAILGEESYSNINVAMMKFRGRSNPEIRNISEFLVLGDERTKLTNRVGRFLKVPYSGGLTPTPLVLKEAVKVFLGRSSANPRNRSRHEPPFPRRLRIHSPLNNQQWCTNNRIILMSDGAPNIPRHYITRDPFSNQLCNTNVKYGNRPHQKESRYSGLCSNEIAAYYAPGSGRDLNTTIPHTQTISIDTIAFHANQTEMIEYLKDIAKHGGGHFFRAGNEAQLTSAFHSIFLDLATASEQAFLRSTIPFNPTDALVSSSEIYIPLFEPEAKAFWRGNLKKYKISVDGNANIRVTDKGGRRVLNNDGSFREGTISYWASDTESIEDGHHPLVGGFAEQLAQQNRTLYTDYDWEKLEHLTLLNSEMGANLSPSANIIQTDTFNDNEETYGPEKASDVQDTTYSRTKKSLRPRWSMTFPQPQMIHDIQIIPADCCVDDMNGFIYSYLYEENGTNQTYVSSMPMVANQTYSISINKEIKEFIITYPVTTSITATTPEHTIALSEVKAFGPPLGDSTTLSWFIDELPVSVRQRPAPQGTNESFYDYSDRLSAWAEAAVRVGGPFHTRPVVVRYQSGQSLVSATPTQTLTSLVFLATSEGVLHAINPKTGREVWGFMPHDKLGNIANFKNTGNLNEGEYPEYGLDGPTRLFTTKNNKKILVFGMRRGGYTYYALDVTDPAAPNLAWKISKTDTGTFQRLGQTWSPPQQIAIKLKSKTDNSVKKHDALIFGGGNNPDSDYGTSRTTTAEQGNAVYIVDLTDGEPLWWASSHNSADLKLDDMKSSIVSRIGAYNLVNREDGLVDRLYFADKGGRIFRVDFNEKTGTAKGYKFADLNGKTKNSHRQFYAPPSPGYYKRGGKEFITIAIGSGQRPDLFNDDVQNRFYVLKDHNVWTYPSTRTATTDSHLTDLKAEYATTTRNKSGFYIDLETREKSFDAAVIYDYKIFFTTYEGNIVKQADVCSAGEVDATHRLYAIDMNTGRAVHNFDNPGQAISDDFSSTHTEFTSIGLPPSLSLFVSGGTTTKDDQGNITAAVGKKLFLMHRIGSDRDKIEFDLKFGPVRSWRRIYGYE